MPALRQRYVYAQGNPADGRDPNSQVGHDLSSSVPCLLEFRKAAACAAGSHASPTSPTTFKGYTVHASSDEPQCEIKSDTTDHIAMHKGSALTKLRT